MLYGHMLCARQNCQEHVVRVCDILFVVSVHAREGSGQVPHLGSGQDISKGPAPLLSDMGLKLQGSSWTRMKLQGVPQFAKADTTDEKPT